MTGPELLDAILSDNEKAALKQFVASEVMFEAVKKVVLTGPYYNGTLRPDFPADPTRNFTLQFGSRLSTEDRGKLLIAQEEGVALVEQGFVNLKTCFKEEEKPKAEKKNEAR